MNKPEKTVPFNLRLPDKLKTKLEKQAREQKRSLNQHIVYSLEQLDEAKPKPIPVAA